MRRKGKRTMNKAALVDRMVGLGRGAFGTGGGRAASCGEAASAVTDSPVGTTTGGASLRREAGIAESADIIAWRWDVKARRVVKASEGNISGRWSSQTNVTVE